MGVAFGCRAFAFGCRVLPVFIVFVCRLLCLYVKKKTILGTNTKSYFHVKTADVFMFLYFWECSIVG